MRKCGIFITSILAFGVKYKIEFPEKKYIFAIVSRIFLVSHVN